MDRAFDARSLIGRTFGDVLDEIAPGWSTWGFGEGGPCHCPVWSIDNPPQIGGLAEILRKLAPILAALREGALAIVAIDGLIPRQVWFAGRWVVYRDERGVERLEVWRTAMDERVEYYSPRFADPTVEASDKKLGYGEVQPALREAMTTYAKQLSRIPTQKGRADFLADKVGCSPSAAKQFLQSLRK